MKKIVLSIAILMLIAASGLALAHPGGTDAYGGHWDHRSGTYHYHNSGSNYYAFATPKPPSRSAPRTAKFVEEPAEYYGATNKKNVYAFSQPSWYADWNMLFSDKDSLVEIIAVAVDEYGDYWYRLSPKSPKSYVHEEDIDLLYYDAYDDEFYYYDEYWGTR